MSQERSEFGERSRLRALLDHFGEIEDPREPWRVAHPLPEILLLVVCGTICDCDDYDGIADWARRIFRFYAGFCPIFTAFLEVAG